MRDVFILLLVFSVIPLIFLRPHVGILAWCWISYMNPHRLTWGVAFDFPVGMVIALATLAAWVLSQEPKKFQLTPVSRSEEHTSELQSLMRISYAVFCLKKKKNKTHNSFI